MMTFSNKAAVYLNPALTSQPVSTTRFLLQSFLKSHTRTPNVW